MNATCVICHRPILVEAFTASLGRTLNRVLKERGEAPLRRGELLPCADCAPAWAERVARQVEIARREHEALIAQVVKGELRFEDLPEAVRIGRMAEIRRRVAAKQAPGAPSTTPATARDVEAELRSARRQR